MGRFSIHALIPARFKSRLQEFSATRSSSATSTAPAGAASNASSEVQDRLSRPSFFTIKVHPRGGHTSAEPGAGSAANQSIAKLRGQASFPATSTRAGALPLDEQLEALEGRASSSLGEPLKALGLPPTNDLPNDMLAMSTTNRAKRAAPKPQPRELQAIAAVEAGGKVQVVAKQFNLTTLEDIRALEQLTIYSRRPNAAGFAMEAGGNVQDVAQKFEITTRAGMMELEQVTINSRMPNTAGFAMEAGGKVQEVAKQFGITSNDGIRALERLTINSRKRGTAGFEMKPDSVPGEVAKKFQITMLEGMSALLGVHKRNMALREMKEPGSKVQAEPFKVNVHVQPFAVEVTLAKQLREQVSDVTGRIAAPKPFAQASRTQSDDTARPDIQAYINKQLGPSAGHTEGGNRPEKTPDEYLSHWNAWAQKRGAFDENRSDAVLRMQEWLKKNSDIKKPTETLNLSGLGLTSLPDHLPASLRSLDLSNNQFIRLPRENPAAIERLVVDPSYDRPKWVGWVRELVVKKPKPGGLEPSQAPSSKTEP